LAKRREGVKMEWEEGKNIILSVLEDLVVIMIRRMKTKNVEELVKVTEAIEKIDKLRTEVKEL